jgi:hypothetical protein
MMITDEALYLDVRILSVSMLQTDKISDTKICNL